MVGQSLPWQDKPVKILLDLQQGNGELNGVSRWAWSMLGSHDLGCFNGYLGYFYATYSELSYN